MRGRFGQKEEQARPRKILRLAAFTTAAISGLYGTGVEDDSSHDFTILSDGLGGSKT